MCSTNDIELPWNRFRWRAPQDSPSWLEHPPLETFRDILAENAEIVASASEFIGGCTLEDFRRRCRAEVSEAAQAYGAEMGWPASLSNDAPRRSWFVTGHQPVLAHPGVWAKNFAVHWMARQTRGVALNLIVDNDLLTSTQLAVPAREDDRLAMHSIPFAEGPSRAPWEEVEVAPSEMFNTFGERVESALREWQIEPLMNAFWPAVIARLPRTRRLSDLFSAARHDVERGWGVDNLELPISRMCGLRSFREFAAHLLARARPFAEVHNQVLAEYRRVYRIRSSTHPVPPLEIGDDHCEAPFWVWRAGEHQRRRVFVHCRGHEVMLIAGRETIAKLPSVKFDGSREEVMIETLGEVASRGYRLRTRALTTTLFARLAIGDIFVHGIGGAQYDEMTNRIVNRFFGIPAPSFFTLTGTLHLPFEPAVGTIPRVSRDERGTLTQQLRDLQYNPDRHVDQAAAAKAADLVAEKKELCRRQNEVDAFSGQTTSQRRGRRAENHQRYRRIRQINAELESLTANRREALRDQVQDLDRRVREERIRLNREFAVWIYPKAELRRFYDRFSPSPPQE